MHTPPAQPAPHSLNPGDPAREAVLQAATAPLRNAVGDRLDVAVERLTRIGSWVFLQGTMRGADGGPPNYTDTVFETRRADGVMSDVYMALLDKADPAITDNDPRGWRVTECAIGPTDIAWLPWSDRHGAPRALFGA
ncbi:hypothetical protein GCM10009676_25870 [Prauserella halophila]|uniref:Uncharacterized protein n=1 Tax=Prauserella halophila TaxID=185641 RepID=A0ABP4GVH3_9PSEU|nr:hypothetical protein [Prauserella halophila]MCP2234962.1 hypothetical protein [Prauserella halophila]